MPCRYSPARRVLPAMRTHLPRRCVHGGEALMLWGGALCVFFLLLTITSREGLTVLLHARRGVRIPVRFDAVDRCAIEACFAILNAAWLLLLFRARVGAHSFAHALALASPFLALAALAVPESTDPSLYLHYGYGANHGISVWHQSSGSFYSPLSALVYWDQPSTYPPLALALFRLAAWGLEVDPALGLTLWKPLCLGAHVATAYVLSSTWNRVGGARAAAPLAFAYLLQPLVLVQVVAEGHIDGFLNLWAALLIRSLLSERLTPTLPLVLLGVSCKMVPLIWLPGTALLLVLRRDTRALLAGVAAVVLALGALALMLPAAEWTVFLNRTTWQMHARSFSAAAIAVEKMLAVDLPVRVVTWAGKLAFGAVWLLSLRRVQRSRTAQTLLEHLTWSTLGLFLFGTTWVVGWYAVALVPLAFFVRSRTLLAAVLAYVLGSSCSFGLDLHESAAISLLIALITTVPPTFFCLLHVANRVRAWRAGEPLFASDDPQNELV